MLAFLFLFIALSVQCISLSPLTSSSCSVPHDRRKDCGYLGVSKDDCERNGCCWSPTENALNDTQMYSSSLDIPWCFHRESVCRGYEVSQKTFSSGNKIVAELRLKDGCRVFGPDVSKLKLEVNFETDTRIHIKLTDALKQRFEVPESVFPRPSVSNTDEESAAYKVVIDQSPFAIKVIRKVDNEIIFDTSSPGGSTLVNPLIYEEQYLEISTRVPEQAHIYGLGEVVHALRRDPKYTRQTMWTRDIPTPVDENLYGTHPFHMELRNGRAHGIFLLNSNGMDILIRQGALTYKVIGGILDFYIFVGPTPQDVIHQYTEVIGRPHMIPYWVLGFHQCRYGYKNIWEVKEVVRRYKEAQLPLETMWTDIDYMDQFKDFSVDPKNFPMKEMQSFVNDLHSKHQKYVLILDPAIKVERGYDAFEDGLKEDIFIKKPDGSVFVGKVWPGPTAFPDFFHPNTQRYWTRWIKKFMDQLPIDGWWIDMNEPASFCNGACGNAVDQLTIQNNKEQLVVSDSEFDPNNPKYKINNAGGEAPLALKTVSPDARHYNNTLHYDVHNLYGHSEAIVTRRSLLDIQPTKRPFVLSRSTFAGTGAHAGHWTGDNWSRWDHLYYSIPGMLNFQLFGIPLVGADICGFIDNTEEELCARWMQLGAFYPFSRNHNAIGTRSQEPYLWESVKLASKNALTVRYYLLPFYYTLFYQAHQFGATVVRPLFFEFPQDKNVPHLDRQFLIGASVLISPVLDQGSRQVNAYFPEGLWYDWYTHRLAAQVQRNTEGQWHRLNAPMDHIPVHVRGGFIVPLQKPAMTTYEARQQDYELLVAMDFDGKATGDLYLDDGESLEVSDSDISYIHFNLDQQQQQKYKLSASGVFNYQPRGKLNQIYVLGLKQQPKNLQLNGEQLSQQYWEYDDQKDELILKRLQLDLTKEFLFTWDI